MPRPVKTCPVELTDGDMSGARQSAKKCEENSRLRDEAQQRAAELGARVRALEQEHLSGVEREMHAKREKLLAGAGMDAAEEKVSQMVSDLVMPKQSQPFVFLLSQRLS